MKKRVVVGLILIVALLASFAFRLIDDYGMYIFDLIIGVLSIFCAVEFARLLNLKGSPSSVIAAALVPIFVFAGHTFFFIFKLEPYFYPIIQMSILILALIATTIIYICLNTKSAIEYKKEKGIGRFKFGCLIGANSFLNFIYPTFFLLGLMVLNRLDMFDSLRVSIFNGNLSWIALAFAFLIPILTDTFAMLCGMLFKGPKLCKKLSPKKTISGAVCSIVLTSAICGALFFAFNAFEIFSSPFAAHNIQFWHFMLLGFFGSIVSQAGDLFESYFKRKANVKDSGTVFPGHGGFLDRFDSHIFNAPFVVLFFMLIIFI